MTGASIAPSEQPHDSGAWEPEPVDTQAMDFPPVDDDVPPADLTPEELELAFTAEPGPLPETPIGTTPEAPVASAPSVPQPVSAPPAVQTPVATVAAPTVPGVPPLTPPVIDNGPMVNPQPVTDAGPTSMPGGLNGTGSPGTPGLTHTESGNSTTSTPFDEPTITILESREATEEEVDASIGGLLEEYPQYSEEALREIAAEESQGGKITLNSLEELEAAVGAHANGAVTGSLQPAANAHHDFGTVDEAGNITEWDVKSLRSAYDYNLEVFLNKTFDGDIAKGEHIVFNTQNMTTEDIQELEQALIGDARFEGMYVLYPAP